LSALPLPRASLESLAQSMRGGGMCLVVLGMDGQVLWHDAQGGLFYQRYVVPLLSDAQWTRTQLTELCGQLHARSAPSAWDLVPGVRLCAAPFVDRRRVSAVLVLAGRADDFSACEDVLRLCGRLGLDAIWLTQQAGNVPPHGADGLLLAMNLLQGMAGDKLRLTALENELQSLSSQLSNTYEELALIDQINGGMRVNRRPDEFFRQACLDVMQVLGVRGMGVALCCTTEHRQPVLYGELSLPPGAVQRLSEQLLASLQQRKGCLLINQLSQDAQYRWLAEWAGRLVAVPLQHQDQLLGCLFGLDKTAGEFDSVDSKLLTSIAGEAAVYLENALLFGDVHDLMMGLLHSLTSAVDAKDAYTCGHSERVALLGRHLAQKLQLPEAEVERVYMAGLLHDVGKIGVPESVLQKTGRLTPEEFEQMKKHPQVGARILDDVKQMERIIPGVLHHHERYDGRGYPAGLAGRQIPLIGRIICLADCLDAMTSNRTYRKALPLEVALCEIRRCSGTQFDPALAETLLQTTSEQFRAVLKDHQEQAVRLLRLQQNLRAG
jgi:putative nucleotidyltransferase with HDIG domain